MKKNVGVGILTVVFLTSALVGGERSAAPTALPPVPTR
jgi:hypothetical protein